MSEFLNLDSIAIIYDGDYLASVPNTYKAFLELLRDKAGLTNDDLKKKTIWRGDFPITCKKDYIRAIKICKDEGIMQIDLVSNELDEKEGIEAKDYIEFLESKEPEEEIKIALKEEENKEETIYINSNVNEFYAVTQVTQYYKNNNNKPVELTIIYPLKKEINFRKFNIKINDKKAYSKIFEKEKAEEKFTDAIASGNVGVSAKYLKEEPNSYSFTISNVTPDSLVELTSEFVQFLTSVDMSLCYSVMSSYPTFSDSISRNYLKNISGKISLKTQSKITRLVNQNFTIDKDFKKEFNQDYTSCDIEFKISNDSKNYNSSLNLLFRTEKMDKPYLLSQYNPEKDETSYIFGMIYDQKPIPIPEKPDMDLETDYYTKYQSNEKADTPSLFIFLIDQSGSMAGSSMKLVNESLLFFLQSLPKNSYFQLIGFGSTFKKINDKPVIYNKENVKYTMDIVKDLKANLGGTDISSPLKEIFNSKDYDDIKLGKNIFILTDGEVDNREECLDLISTNCEKFKIHAIGMGGSFDKKLIQNAGIQGKGSYYFVNNTSQINSIIIQSLSKCLRNYILDAKLSLDKIKPEYEYLPKINFIYPDEILNFYFIIKGKNEENIQINFNSKDKNENYAFTKDNIIKEKEGDLISQIIIGNLLKNSELDENLEVKLSKNYQILSKKTSLFAVVENEEQNKIAEFKQVKKKEKNNFNLFNFNNNNNFNNNINNNNFSSGVRSANYNIRNNYRNDDVDYAMPRYEMRRMMEAAPRMMEAAPRMNYMSMARSKGRSNYRDEDEDEDEYNDMMEMENANDMEYEKEEKEEINMDEELKCKRKCKKKEKKECRMGNAYGYENKKDEILISKESNKKESVKEEKEVKFSNKELVLTQDIFDGCWNLNPQTKLLIEKEKITYELIEKLMKEKKLDKEEINVTLLVLYYLNTNTSINKMEYSLIMKKGINYLEQNGIKFEEIFEKIKK